MLKLPDLSGVDVLSTDWTSRHDEITQLLRAGAILASIHAHFDRAVSPSAWTATPPDKAHAVRDALLSLQSTSQALASVLSSQPAPSKPGIETLVAIAHRIQHAPDLQGLAVQAPEWASCRDDLQSALSAAARLAQLHALYDSTLKPEAWNVDFSATRPALNSLGRKWTRIFSSQYRKARRHLASLC